MTSPKGIVVNFWAAPGSGKSTMAAGLFHRLKCQRINTELTNEYAKDLVWSGRNNDLKDQLYILAKQKQRVERLVRNCDIVISDSPILMYNVYLNDQYPDCFRDTLRWAWDQYDNINFLIERDHPYDPVGRTQDEDGAMAVHREIEELLLAQGVPHWTIPSTELGLDHATTVVKDYLSSKING